MRGQDHTEVSARSARRHSQRQVPPLCLTLPATHYLRQLDNVLRADGGLLVVVLDVNVDNVDNLVVLGLAVLQVWVRAEFKKNRPDQRRQPFSRAPPSAGRAVPDAPRTTSSKMRLSQVMMT